MLTAGRTPTRTPAATEMAAEKRSTLTSMPTWCMRGSNSGHPVTTAFTTPYASPTPSNPPVTASSRLSVTS